MRIEPPQTLDLRLRELQARHFQVLRPNKAKPIADGPRLSSHELSVGKQKVRHCTSTRHRSASTAPGPCRIVQESRMSFSEGLVGLRRIVCRLPSTRTVPAA